MSGVTPPSDGGYTYYQKRLSDLEDELKRDTQRAKERMEDRTHSLEESYKQNLSHRDENNERTINNVKQQAQETIAREHEFSKAEIDRIKAQTYDKWGRMGGVESDVLSQQLHDLKAQSDVREKQTHAQLDDTEAAYERRYEELNRAHQQELEKVTTAAHEAARESYESSNKENNARIQDLKTENKRAEARMEERIRSMEEGFKRDLAKRDEDNAHTVQNVKDRSQETIANERAYAKADMDQLRNQTYDKWGRYGGNESDVVTQQLRDLKDASEVRHRQDKANLDDAQAAYDHRLEEISRDQESELERVAKAAHDSANETYETSIKGERNQYEQMRDEAKKSFEELNRKQAEEANFQRRQTEKFVNEARHDFEHRLKNEVDSNSARFQNAQRAYAGQAENATQRLNDSHDDESRVLRDQIKDLVAAEGRYMKEKGQGTHDAIEEYDKQNLTERKVLQEDYEKQIAKLKQEANEQETYLAHLNNRNLSERDRYFAGLISKHKQEAHEEQNELERTFNHDRSQLETRNKHDREQAREVLEHQLHDASEAKDVALENQAKQYQDTIQRNRQSDDEKIKNLEKELLYKSTSDDTALISPAAEQAVRKSVIKEYEKLKQAEQERNHRSEDSIQRAYADRLQGSVLENDAKRTTEQHEYAAERHHDQAEFLQHMQDTEFQRDLSLRNNEIDHDRQTENLNRNYSQMMLKQRNEYEGILEAAKNDAASRISAIRQESEFASKMAQRAFSARQNELMRDYEKKLADQKNDYDAKFEEVKEQSQTAIRESERRSRQALDEQARGYEQRITALEAQHKERERYITQNYQDDLEKVRRSNALLVSKKS